MPPLRKQRRNLGAEVDDDPIAEHVDAAHLGGLRGPLLATPLIDTNGIDPDQPDAPRRPHEPQQPPAVPGMQHHVPVRPDVDGARAGVVPVLAGPAVRGGLVGRAVGQRVCLQAEVHRRVGGRGAEETCEADFVRLEGVG